MYFKKLTCTCKLCSLYDLTALNLKYFAKLVQNMSENRTNEHDQLIKYFIFYDYYIFFKFSGSPHGPGL